jgi:hypothetical protein
MPPAVTEPTSRSQARTTLWGCSPRTRGRCDQAAAVAHDVGRGIATLEAERLPEGVRTLTAVEHHELVVLGAEPCKLLAQRGDEVTPDAASTHAFIDSQAGHHGRPAIVRTGDGPNELRIPHGDQHKLGVPPPETGDFIAEAATRGRETGALPQLGDVMDIAATGPSNGQLTRSNISGRRS